MTHSEATLAMGHAPSDHGARPVPGWIALARHGKPALSRKVRLNRYQYRDWWRMYDASGLAPGQSPPPGLCELGAQADLVLASTLRRAVETAQAVRGAKPIVQNDLFVEAALPPPPLPGRYNPGAWGVLARAAWWCGMSGEEESRREADARAHRAALFLIAKAETGENVLLLAHGWFNRMIRPHLRKQGWACRTDGGDKYWSHRLYVQRERS